MRYWRRFVGLTWWLNVWKRKKNTNIIRWLSFSFFGRKWTSIFVFGQKWNFIFIGIFVYGRKWKMLFGRPLVYITKRSWSWDAKSWSSSWKLGLVLVLVLKLRSWSWKKSWLHHWYCVTGSGSALLRDLGVSRSTISDFLSVLSIYPRIFLRVFIVSGLSSLSNVSFCVELCILLCPCVLVVLI